MNPAFRIILALSMPLAACGQSKPELFLDRTTTALECAAANDPDCAPGTPRSGDSDAGAARPGADECYQDVDCEYGEVCERRHGVSACQPEDGRHRDEDGHGGSGGDDGYDDGHGGGDSGSGGSGPDAGAACDPASWGDDNPHGDDDCYGDDDHHGGDDDSDEDRSGSNSGRH